MSLRVECRRWKQTAEDLRQAAVTAGHARERERFLALYEITRGSTAARVAAQTGRHHQSVIAWVHLYNDRGPTALAFRHTGGHPPFADGWPAPSPRSSRRSTPRRPRRRV